MRLQDLLLEAKKKPKKKIIFVDNGNDQEPYPDDTMSALEKDIRKAAKDLQHPAKGPITLVNDVMTEYNVPIPQAYLSKRFEQYRELLTAAVKALGSARGYKTSW